MTARYFREDTMDQDTYDKGLAIRTAVLGEEYVRTAAGNVDAFSKPLQDLVTEYCWGAVWGRDGLELKTRSMLNLAMIAVLNRPNELSTHLRGALTNGVTREEICEIFLQVGIYAASRPRSTASGWPAPCSPTSTRARQPMSEPIGFIGLGNMGFPMISRLSTAGFPVVVFDVRADVLANAAALGAQPARSVRDVADRAETVLASLPTPQISESVVADVATGSRVQRFVDLSTVGGQAAQRNHALLGARGIAALDSPVSGGMHGAQAGTLAIMVSGPRSEFDSLATVFEVLGRAIFVSEQPGAAQTMKLINNLMAATTLAATAEVMVMGVKAGLSADVMIDVLNAGSGGTHASRDKFPRAVLPARSTTGLPPA